MELHKLSDEKLRSLAEDPTNIVYRYEDGAIPLRVLSLPEVKDNIQRLWERFKDLKAGRTISQKQCRRIRTKLETEGWASFSATHPLIFDRVVDPKTGEPEIKALLYMIFLKDLQAQGAIANGPERLQQYILDTFAVSEETYRAQGGEVHIIDPQT